MEKEEILKACHSLPDRYDKKLVRSNMRIIASKIDGDKSVSGWHLYCVCTVRLYKET